MSHIVSVHSGRWNMPNFGEYYLEYGIYLPRLAEIHPYQAGKKSPSVRDCIIQESVAHFEVNHDSDIDLLGMQFIEAWHQQGEKWFSNYSNSRFVIEFLLERRHFPMAAASACLYFNDTLRAKEIVEDHLRKHPESNAFVSGWLARNNLG